MNTYLVCISFEMRGESKEEVEDYIMYNLPQTYIGVDIESIDNLVPRERD